MLCFLAETEGKEKSRHNYHNLPSPQYSTFPERGRKRKKMPPAGDTAAAAAIADSTPKKGSLIESPISSFPFPLIFLFPVWEKAAKWKFFGGRGLGGEGLGEAAAATIITRLRLRRRNGKEIAASDFPPSKRRTKINCPECAEKCRFFKTTPKAPESLHLCFQNILCTWLFGSDSVGEFPFSENGGGRVPPSFLVTI